MRLPDFQYVEPKSLQEASLFLKNHGHECKIISGGTDLLPSMKQRIFRPKYLVALDTIPDLDGIEFDEQSGLRIGALVKLRTLENEPTILKRYPIIGQAARAIGSVQLRQMGTVGGNLCLDSRCSYYNQTDFWRKCRPKCIKMGGEVCNAIGGGNRCFAVFAGDLAPALIALDGQVKIHSFQGERRLPLSEFYTGDWAKPIAVGPEEILAGVELPTLPGNTFGIYLKYRIRNSLDFSLASVAARLGFDGEDKVCRESKMVIGAVGTRPQGLKEISGLLEGKRLELSMIEEASHLAYTLSKPVGNAASSPSYRRLMIKVLTKKALHKALEEST